MTKKKKRKEIGGEGNRISRLGTRVLKSDEIGIYSFYAKDDFLENCLDPKIEKNTPLFIWNIVTCRSDK